MADGGGSRLRAVPFPVEDPERIPVKRYYDEEFYKLEVEHLWPHIWQMACRIEQIPNVGDYIEYTNLGKSVLVVRTNDGIKAFNNACRHRGVRVAKGHGNCKTQGFICPFHGWRYGLDGKNTFVYGKQIFSERQLEQAELALVPCRVELWGGCAFINHDNDAPSLRESFGSVTDRFEKHGLANLRAEWCYATVLPANWKVAMEAFMEGYHVMKTHPQLQKVVPGMFNTRYGHDTGSGVALNPNISKQENIAAQLQNIELLSIGMGGMVHAKEVEIAGRVQAADITDDPATIVPSWYAEVQQRITTELRAKGEPVPDLNVVKKSDPVNAVEFMFPHYFLLPYFASMAAYRIRPLGPESCFFEIWSLTQYAEGKEPPPVMDPVVLPYDSDKYPPIPAQDYSNIPDQQVGLHADGFEYMRLSKDVEGLISNYQRILDGYLKGQPLDVLAKASAKLGGNFDGPILDLGL